ncbi:MAG: hypothetical protein SVV03_02000 [Candidatus Nanohaloarchaea archaeon]|nr:hypothetical protein [Candidatus Nanohaloarchaea archaeon]
MNSKRLRSRKGQSAIEYLTTYGWALLAIVIVGAVLVNLGVFNQCQKATPRFSGQPASIDAWAYTGSDAIDMSIRAASEKVNVTAIKLQYDDGWKNTTGLNTVIPAGETSTFSLTGLNRDSGACASADVLLEYTLTDNDIDAKTSGSGQLRGPVP